MRKLQEIFDVVIAEQFYGTDDNQTAHMCNALTRAAAAGVITWQERDKATAAIRKYLFHLKDGSCGRVYHTLAGAMTFGIYGGVGYVPFDRTLEVYQNWKLRPKLKFQR